jgi:hypothetical protein
VEAAGGAGGSEVRLQMSCLWNGERVVEGERMRIRRGEQMEEREPRPKVKKRAGRPTYSITDISYA